MQWTSLTARPSRFVAHSHGSGNRSWLAFLAVGLSFLIPPQASAQNQPIPKPLDGVWLTDGYGEAVEFKASELRVYEITKVSCIPSDTARLKKGSEIGDEIAFAGNDDTFRIVPGPSKDTLWLHEDGAASNILLRRTNFLPKSCGHAPANTPLSNYEVFWQTFAEQYAFFRLRNLDWQAVDKNARPRVTADTSPEELFGILQGMVEPLHDKHVYINSRAMKKHFRGDRPRQDTLQDQDKPCVTEIIETKYVLGQLRNFCNRQLQFGRLREPIAYLRIHSFARYSTGDDFEKQYKALQAALDDIFQGANTWSGLVIDIRINSGGSDPLGVAIASRLATKNYLAFAKAARDDIRDPNRHTPPQQVMVQVSPRPGFRGPVVLLTSAHAVSAAETFVMALLGREPHVTRIGGNTQGVFSDELGRALPNGWNFGLSNETYFTKDGKTFEGTGVPPDIKVPIFPKEDLAAGRDSCLDKALQLLAPRGK